jgi:hypothetical protein
MSDRKLVKWLLLLLLLPLGLSMFSEDRFRYPCQDPANWDKDICKMPLCDVTRTCPEHIFKGQRDPRLGPPKDEPNKISTPPAPALGAGPASQGANCGK